MAICSVCFRHCDLSEGQRGFCMGRICEEGRIRAANYGRLTALALDPIEKKPLRRFHPGSLILSVGSYGCNLRCPFCQNSSISWSEEAERIAADPSAGGKIREVTPRRLADLAVSCKEDGNVGVAFTYNEPLIGYEFVRDTARLVHEAGMLNVMVTNGTAASGILRELEPHIDAMNIDLKGFSDPWYEKVLGGDRRMVMDFIEQAVCFAHVELTTLIIPGENDSEEEIRRMSRWISGLRDSKGRLIGPRIPLHISRFFPQFYMTDREPTEREVIYRLAEIAGEELQYVFTGNC